MTCMLPYHMVLVELRVPYILSGYRQTHQNWRYYLASICRLHNETINIWTVLIGAVILLLKAYKDLRVYEAAGSTLKWTPLVYSLCSLTALVFSTITNTFHSRSPHINYFPYSLDYFGFCI